MWHIISFDKWDLIKRTTLHCSAQLLIGYHYNDKFSLNALIQKSPSRNVILSDIHPQFTFHSSLLPIERHWSTFLLLLSLRKSDDESPILKPSLFWLDTFCIKFGSSWLHLLLLPNVIILNMLKVNFRLTSFAFMGAYFYPGRSSLLNDPV